METLTGIDPQELIPIYFDQSTEVLPVEAIQVDRATGIGDGSGLPTGPLVTEERNKAEHPYSLS